jgi:hypothetical protein
VRKTSLYRLNYIKQFSIYKSNKSNEKMKAKKLLLIVALGFSLGSFAVPFTPGNIVVTRIYSQYSTGGSPNLDEYTPDGVWVQSIYLTGVANEFYITNQNECGITTLSGDGQYLTLAGLGQRIKGLETSAVTVPRKIALIKYDGTYTFLTPTSINPAATVATITEGIQLDSPDITLAAANSAIKVGHYVFGIGIPIGAKVASINGTTLTMDVNATRTATDPSLTIMISNTPLYSHFEVNKAAYTTNGADFWLSTNENIQYYNPTLNNGVPVNIVADDARCLTQVDGKLWKTTRYGKEVATIGTTLNPFPTTPQTASNTSLPFAVGSASPEDANQIIGLDLDPNVSGQDVIYVTDNELGSGDGGIKKYSKVNGVWTFNGGIGLIWERYSGVTAKVTAPGVVTLFAIRKPTFDGYYGGELIRFVDKSGYNASPDVAGTETKLDEFDITKLVGRRAGSWKFVNFVPVQANPNAVSVVKELPLQLVSNPVADMLHIKFGTLKNNETLNIFNLSGKLVVSKQINAGSTESSFSVSEIENGMYFVKMGGAVIKFIKR